MQRKKKPSVRPSPDVVGGLLGGLDGCDCGEVWGVDQVVSRLRGTHGFAFIHRLIHRNFPHLVVSISLTLHVVSKRQAIKFMYRSGIMEGKVALPYPKLVALERF